MARFLAATASVAMATILSARAGSSQFAAPKPDDVTFVNDIGSGAGAACVYRSGGPIRFAIKTTRYVGETNPDGTLRDADALAAAGVVGRTARLSMPGFDVDYDANSPPYAPERDLVYFNGRPLGYLRGVNNAWVLNAFEIPIAHVRFPSRGANGAAPTPVSNEIVIDIDTANPNPPPPGEPWCTAIDWAALAINAVSPAVLIHGNGSDGGFFERQGFAAALRAKRVPFDLSIKTSPNFVDANAASLDRQLAPIVRSFGVDSVHLIAHSKGGLDAREYLARYQHARTHDFKVLSLTTLSTPHDGSVLADILIANRAALRQAAFVEFSGLPGMAAALARLRPPNDGHDNLTTGFAAGFNAANLSALPKSTRYFSVAADADTNGNAAIDFVPDEYRALRTENTALNVVHALSADASRSIVDAMYQTLRRAAGVTLGRGPQRTVGGRPVETLVIAGVPAAAPLGNDTLVTIPSAQGQGGFVDRVSDGAVFNGRAGRNHSNVADGTVAEKVLSWIFDVEFSIGDWSR